MQEGAGDCGLICDSFLQSCSSFQQQVREQKLEPFALGRLEEVHFTLAPTSPPLSLGLSVHNRNNKAAALRAPAQADRFFMAGINQACIWAPRGPSGLAVGHPSRARNTHSHNTEHLEARELWPAVFWTSGFRPVIGSVASAAMTVP
ncbi:hypothetical protein AAFF_G00251840 [Aldrovandia affinis]|uniref:Uncharacterized protein n=1 Tax=Aldrovandia affinis TaxID=143900 RepID=A0AAD7STI4_9TELE|nr:hypothetical protein AAFF_G00251840 [Aldrovandia affinis]